MLKNEITIGDYINMAREFASARNEKLLFKMTHQQREHVVVLI